MKFLVVVDVQNDFTTGVLGTKEAENAISYIQKKIDEAIDNGVRVIYTQDTHYDDYLETSEGKYLPIPHCIINTWGQKVVNEVDIPECVHISKDTFSTTASLMGQIYVMACGNPIEEIEFCGFCTDICVISNALMTKSSLSPYEEIRITVDPKACAGTTPERHNCAIEVMKSCQIEIKED